MDINDIRKKMSEENGDKNQPESFWKGLLRYMSVDDEYYDNFKWPKWYMQAIGVISYTTDKIILDVIGLEHPHETFSSNGYKKFYETIDTFIFSLISIIILIFIFDPFVILFNVIN